MPYTIGQIIDCSYDLVLKTMRNDHKFVVPSLNCKLKHGKITSMTLGAYVVVPQWDGTTKEYRVSQVGVPISWTKEDEIRNPTEANRINLVKTMLENGLHSHDFLLNRKIKKGRAVVSNEFLYYRTPIHESPIGEFSTTILTAVAFIN